MIYKLLPYTVLAFVFFACHRDHTASSDPIGDLLLSGGMIYTMDTTQEQVEAVVIKADTFLFVGSLEKAQSYVGPQTKSLDLEGKTMIPGLTEGHAHIMGIGYGLLNVDLAGARSFEEIIQRVADRASEVPNGTWIQGRGWHQEKWAAQPELFKGFPMHYALSEAVPNHPVYLQHASGHAAMVNQKAMELAGIEASSPNPEGGEIFRTLSGDPTGLLNETAQYLMNPFLPKNSRETDEQALDLALKACFENGITGFHQAGSGEDHIQLFEDFAEKNRLKLRLYVMLAGRDSALLARYFEAGIQENLYNNQLTIRAVKLYSDGALGSRGAWLLEEYSDAPGVHGHNVMPLDEVEAIANKAHDAGFQMCVHAIGDRANKEVLDIYERVVSDSTKEIKSDHRFRIEHAQHFHSDDIPRVAKMGVVPAMQAIHMSSDRPWAIHRLGRTRIESGAYMWQTLLQSGARIVNGTDAPVEPIDPMANFYASVSRKTLKGTPSRGYEPAEKMTRRQALKSYTLDAAFSAFREQSKGSIEVGKWADLTILDQDIMTLPEDEILDTQVQMTIIAGEIVYDADRMQ